MLKITLAQRTQATETLMNLGFQEIQRGMFRYGILNKDEEFFCAWSLQEKDGDLVAVKFYTHRQGRHLNFLEEDEAPEDLREVVRASENILREL